MTTTIFPHAMVVPLIGRWGNLQATTLINEADMPLFDAHAWHLGPDGYVCRYKNRRTILLHREIVQTPPGLVTDHINRNKLDNRRENLRAVTTAENFANCERPTRAGKCTERTAWGYYRVTMRRDGITYSLGTFSTADEADAVSMSFRAALAVVMGGATNVQR